MGQVKQEKGLYKFLSRQTALQGETIHIHGDGAQIRAWCYVDDLVDCIYKCLTYPEAIGESFNIGNARTAITILGLAETICRILKSESEIVFDPPLSADIALRIPVVVKAEELLSFKAKVDLEEGIRRTSEWFK